MDGGGRSRLEQVIEGNAGAIAESVGWVEALAETHQSKPITDNPDGVSDLIRLEEQTIETLVRNRTTDGFRWRSTHPTPGSPTLRRYLCPLPAALSQREFPGLIQSFLKEDGRRLGFRGFCVSAYPRGTNWARDGIDSNISALRLSIVHEYAGLIGRRHGGVAFGRSFLR
jgi:hypothetical protein